MATLWFHDCKDLKASSKKKQRMRKSHCSLEDIFFDQRMTFYLIYCATIILYFRHTTHHRCFSFPHDALASCFGISWILTKLNHHENDVVDVIDMLRFGISLMSRVTVISKLRAVSVSEGVYFEVFCACWVGLASLTRLLFVVVVTTSKKFQYILFVLMLPPVNVTLYLVLDLSLFILFWRHHFLHLQSCLLRHVIPKVAIAHWYSGSFVIAELIRWKEC